MFSVHAVHDNLFLYTCLRLHFIMTDCLSNMIINPWRMRIEGYSSRSVCLSKMIIVL